MLAECADVGSSAKIATLRKPTKGCKAQIKFKGSSDRLLGWMYCRKRSYQSVAL